MNRRDSSMALAGLLLTSCALFPPPPPPTVTAGRGAELKRVCFLRGIDSFSRATPASVVLKAGHQRHYEIEFRGACLGLRNARSLALSSHSACLASGDRIYPVPTLTGGAPPDSCLVQHIYEWRPASAD